MRSGAWRAGSGWFVCFGFGLVYLVRVLLLLLYFCYCFRNVLRWFGQSKLALGWLVLVVGVWSSRGRVGARGKYRKITNLEGLWACGSVKSEEIPTVGS